MTHLVPFPSHQLEQSTIGKVITWSVPLGIALFARRVTVYLRFLQILVRRNGNNDCQSRQRLQKVNKSQLRRRSHQNAGTTPPTFGDLLVACNNRRMFCTSVILATGAIESDVQKFISTAFMGSVLRPFRCHGVQTTDCPVEAGGASSHPNFFADAEPGGAGKCTHALSCKPIHQTQKEL